jgi:hypothetical protein
MQRQDFNAMDMPAGWSKEYAINRRLMTRNTIKIFHFPEILLLNIKSFDLCIDPVTGDGDCAFASIIRQVRKSSKWQNANGKLRKHVTDRPAEAC